MYRPYGLGGRKEVVEMRREKRGKKKEKEEKGEKNAYRGRALPPSLLS